MLLNFFGGDSWHSRDGFFTPSGAGSFFLQNLAHSCSLPLFFLDEEFALDEVFELFISVLCKTKKNLVCEV